MLDDYIFPNLSIHSNFDEAKKFQEDGGEVSYYRENTAPLQPKDLTQGKRNLIIGEPGIGKSSLLYSVQIDLQNDGYRADFVSLGQTDCEERIDAFISEAGQPRALLLDALDEIPSKIYPRLLRKIESLSEDHPDLLIFLSSRWVFVSKYVATFPEYRFISVSPFTKKQVREYLSKKGHSDAVVSELLEKVSSFSNQTNILQVPRYLTFLTKFLKKTQDVEAASRISRNELFEYFIYSDLEEEDKKSGNEKSAITKRLLEKLALAMEIYQTNVITKDELMTFFDEVASDLKVVALAQFRIQDLIHRSLLKPNYDTIEFDNSEFQEYLAAKEITRLSDPNRAAFNFAVDSSIQEIYPTWYNALSFLVDMRSDLLEQLVEFSGLRNTSSKVVDEGLLNFISKVNPKPLCQDTRRRLFKDVIGYHEQTRLWIPWNLSRGLVGFYDPSLEQLLKATVEKAEGQAGTSRFVPLGNVAGILSSLSDANISFDRPYWIEKLIQYASETADNSVLQRNALYALEMLRDTTVIDRLPNLLGSEQLVEGAFLSMCAAVDPDNPKSVEYFIDAIRRNIFQGRYGLFKITSAGAIKRFLTAFNTDDKFRDEFLEKASIFSRGEDLVLVEHIEGVFDQDVDLLIRESVRKAIQRNLSLGNEKSEFAVGLVKVLSKHNAGFYREMVAELSAGQAERPGLFYYAHGLFAEALEINDVPDFLDAMCNANQDNLAFRVMQKAKVSGRESADQIYEAGRAKLSQLYNEWEEQPISDDLSQRSRVLKNFRNLLEPEPGQFNHSVFDYFNRHVKELVPLLEDKDKTRLTELLTGTVFKFIDPGEARVTITQEAEHSRTFSYSSNIPLFGSAAATAKHLGRDLSPYRQKIIDLIPFAYGDVLKIVFDVVKSVQPDEMKSVLAVYQDHKSDLWRHQPLSFIDAVERYHIVEGASVLKGMVVEHAYDRYTRRRALEVADSIAPDLEYLLQIFSQFGQATGDERELAYVANSLLITSHNDAASIRWRLKEVVKRAMPHTEQTGAHTVGDLESELWEKSFAKPLMQLKHPGYENDYLELLDEATSLWTKGPTFYSYTQYLWEIVYMYFDNLKDQQSYEPLRKLEDKVVGIKYREGSNWLAAKMVHLRRSYLAYVGKPRNISEAIKKYNVARAYDNKKIDNSEDLFQQIQDALNTELRRWIEGEGAYELIRGDDVYDRATQPYEELIQKTLKAQVENIMLRRGFQIDLIREPQLYDRKRVDILLTYGFTGPIVIEIKLTSNSDLKGKKLDKSKSYESMSRYMDGYGAQRGIFLVIDNHDVKNLPEIKDVFERIPNVLVQTFKCPGVKGSSTKERKKGAVELTALKIPAKRKR